MKFKHGNVYNIITSGGSGHCIYVSRKKLPFREGKEISCNVTVYTFLNGIDVLHYARVDKKNFLLVAVENKIAYPTMESIHLGLVQFERGEDFCNLTKHTIKYHTRTHRRLYEN